MVNNILTNTTLKVGPVDDSSEPRGLQRGAIINRTHCNTLDSLKASLVDGFTDLTPPITDPGTRVSFDPVGRAYIKLFLFHPRIIYQFHIL